MPNGARLRHWAIALSNFDFDIKYISGKVHSDVDCLSRAPVDHEIDPSLENKILAVVNEKPPPNYDRCTVGRVIPLDIRDWRTASEAVDEASEHYSLARQRKKGTRFFSVYSTLKRDFTFPSAIAKT